ncbi:DUF2634 domain-containing protein [Brevibacillus daliensis]|uniref:DUF2634 domain-containing protein n=1 Tax=Brevibacillus daliensis TaxID=2892995 RepID=UPI00359FA50D
MITEDEMNQEVQLRMPWTYRIDWGTNQLMQGADGRYIRTSSYAEYLEEVCKKILNTKRFQYQIYSDRMGVDYFDHIGKVPKYVSLSMIQREAEDALEAHPEIERAEVSEVRFVENRVAFFVSIEGVRGKTKVVVNTWQQ